MVKIENEIYFNAKETAKILKVSEKELRNSRKNNILYGLNAPQHKKIGNRILYSNYAIEKYKNLVKKRIIDFSKKIQQDKFLLREK